MSSQSDPDDFDVAKSIVSQVKDLPSDRRERIFRWVAESIGLLALPSRPTAPTPAHLAAPASQSAEGPSLEIGGSRDIKTFISSKEPKGDTQYAAAVAYYYRFEAPAAQRRDTINASILQEATRLTGRPRFTSPRNTLNNVKKAGYLDSSSPGEFSINSVGENLVAMTLPSGTDILNRRAATRKSSKKKKR